MRFSDKEEKVMELIHRETAIYSFCPVDFRFQDIFCSLLLPRHKIAGTSIGFIFFLAKVLISGSRILC